MAEQASIWNVRIPLGNRRSATSGYSIHAKGVATIERIQYSGVGILGMATSRVPLEICMNFAQLEYFLIIAQTGSFSNASEHAHISQSSLSKQIKALERELKTEVFVRDSSGVSLTPAGEVLYEFSVKMFDSYHDVLSRMAQYGKQVHKHIRIGALPLLADYSLSSIIADFQLENMDIQVDIFEREQANIERRLALGQVDLAVMRTDYTDPEHYEWLPLARDELIIVSPAEHPLAEIESISLSKLKDAEFVLLGEDSQLRRLFEEACRRAGFSPNVIFSHARHESLLAAVKKGIGISALPRELTRIDYPGEFAYTALEDPIETEISLVYPRRSKLNEPGRRLYEFFESALDNGQPDFGVPQGTST